MSKSTESVSGGVGFSGFLALLFIALKLTGHITWSWWWVLAPLWISALIAILLIAFVIAFWIFTGRSKRGR